MTEDSEQSVKENKDNSKTSVSLSRVKNSSSTKSTSFSATNQKKDKSRDTQQNRVVIRQLPPTMTSEEFLEAISPIPEYNDYYFCRADTSLGTFGFCRSYINFIHMEDVFVFKDKFDGYVFVDSKGNEFIAIVEFAPFQRILRRRVGANGQPVSAKKRDNKCGTIEQDSDYIQFLEELEKIKNEANMPSADVYLEEIEARDKQLRANHGVIKVSTPLIEFIKNKKLEKIRLREERREERKRQQLEQKRIREEEQIKKLKLLKQSDENKSSKESEQKSRDREKSGKSEDEKLRHKSKDLDKKNKNFTKNSDNKRTDINKRSEKKSYQYKSEKPKDSNNKESKDKESTFVVKIVSNPDEDNKSESNVVDSSDAKKSDPNKDVSKEQNKKKEETKGDKSESFSKNKNENSNRSETKRIRNKDRPTREIYRPGAKRSTDEQTPQQNQSNTQKASSHKSEQSSSGYKQRVFTRSKQ